MSDISASARSIMEPGYRLVRVDSGSDGFFEIALLNDVDETVPYYNKVHVAFIEESSPRAATQCLVRRSTDVRHSAAVRDVVHNVFFNYLVEHYDIVLSDNPGTGGGRSFWQSQISRAIAYGLCVSYQAENGQLLPLPTQGALDELVDQLWSEDSEQQDQLVLISKVSCASNASSSRPGLND